MSYGWDKARQLEGDLDLSSEEVAERRRLQADITACRYCGSNRVVPIVYGMPGLDLARRVERGEVVLGGCVVGHPGGDPTHRCLECGAEMADKNQEEE